jgi:hypothetical protein
VSTQRGQGALSTSDCERDESPEGKESLCSLPKWAWWLLLLFSACLAAALLTALVGLSKVSKGHRVAVEWQEGICKVCCSLCCGLCMLLVAHRGRCCHDAMARMRVSLGSSVSCRRGHAPQCACENRHQSRMCRFSVVWMTWLICMAGSIHAVSCRCAPPLLHVLCIGFAYSCHFPFVLFTTINTCGLPLIFCVSPYLTPSTAMFLSSLINL